MGDNVSKIKSRSITIPDCPICNQSRSVGRVISITGKSERVRTHYYCTNCDVEFNESGTCFPPLLDIAR